MNDKTYDFTEAQFKAWVASKPDDTPIGIPGKPGKCALANFMRETLGIECLVTGRQYYVRSVMHPIPLKEWASRLTYDFDRITDEFTTMDTHDYHHFVTKANWLRWLKVLEENKTLFL